MSKQYHYIVMYDNTTKDWVIDYDVSINHDNGHIWNTKTEEWEGTWDDDAEDAIFKDLRKRITA